MKYKVGDIISPTHCDYGVKVIVLGEGIKENSATVRHISGESCGYVSRKYCLSGTEYIGRGNILEPLKNLMEHKFQIENISRKT